MAFPISIEEIKKTEEKLKVKFPESFKKKMEEDNGGQIDIGEGWFIIPFRNSASNKMISRTANDIVNEIKNNEGYLPEGLIPFAEDGAGNYLVFKVSDSEILEEKVYKWLHDQDGLQEVCKDFSELVIA